MRSENSDKVEKNGTKIEFSQSSLIKNQEMKEPERYEEEEEGIL